MLQSMHDVLNEILYNQAEKGLSPLDTSFKRVIGSRHEVQHPGECQIPHQQAETFWLRVMSHQALNEIVGSSSFGLYRSRLIRKELEFEEEKEKRGEDLTHSHCSNSQG